MAQPQQMQMSQPGSGLGREVVTLKGKGGTTMVLLEGAIRVEHVTEGMQGFPYGFPCCCFCLKMCAETKSFEIIPKQCVVEVSVDIEKTCCCCPCCCCCHKRGTYVRFTMARGGDSKFGGNTSVKSVKFDWSMEEAKEYAKTLHDYVYGPICGSGKTQEAHTLAHLINQVRHSHCVARMAWYVTCTNLQGIMNKASPEFDLKASAV